MCMRKRILSTLLILCMSLTNLPALADNGMEAKLNSAVSSWNAQNRGTEFEITQIPDDIKEYVKSLPSDVELELYKRDIPDVTKHMMRNEYNMKISDETLPWYQSLPKEEKQQAFVERLKMSDEVAFPDNYKVGYVKSGGLSSVLANLLVGEEENIERANKILVNDLGKDQTLMYHSDMTTFTFTDIQPYVIWYDYGDKLTKEAKDSLYRYIVRIGRKNSGFSPYKTSMELAMNCLHNQGSEGFLEGILYAEIADDARMLKRMEDYLDRCLAHLGGIGEVGDTWAPGYGAFTYTNFLTAYNYVEDERIKGKLEILLDYYNTIIANFYHDPSNSLAGPFYRAYGCQYYSIVEKQDYRTLLHLMMDGTVFAPEKNSIGYSFWFSNAAALKFYFPDYIQRLIKNREYPYEITIIGEANNDLANLYGRIGFYQTSLKRRYERRAYETEDYTIGARQPGWYNTGRSGQDAVFRATWRRNADTTDIKDVSDIGLMWSMYGVDTDLEVSPDNMKTWPTYDYPNGDGKEFALLNKNKAIIMGWPGLVDDKGGANYYQLSVKEYTDMGETMFVSNYEECKGIWYGDQFVTGEMTVLQSGDEEVRLKATGLGVPTRLKGDENIYIEDFNTYVSLQPINTTSLGRDYDIGITDFGKQAFDSGFGGGALAYQHNMLAITAYNYYGEKKSIPREERIKQRNGFIVEMGDKNEYKTIDGFKAHIKQSVTEINEDGDNWEVKYTSGEDTMELDINTMTMRVNESYTNGEPLYMVDYNQSGKLAKSSTEVDPETKISYYKWNKMDFFDWLDYEPYKETELVRSDVMVQSTKKEIVLGDTVLENPSGSSVMLIHEPTENQYIFLNLTNKTASFKLKTPDGTVDIKNLNYGRVVYSPDNEGEKVETMIVPRMTLLETTVTVSGKE